MMAGVVCTQKVMMVACMCGEHEEPTFFQDTMTVAASVSEAAVRVGRELDFRIIEAGSMVGLPAGLVCANLGLFCACEEAEPL
jgi:uncharacterized oligopeptide transporter (OPT) family protein